MCQVLFASGLAHNGGGGGGSGGAGGGGGAAKGNVAVGEGLTTGGDMGGAASTSDQAGVPSRDHVSILVATLEALLVISCFLISLPLT
jgi:hypothetical protein